MEHCKPTTGVNFSKVHSCHARTGFRLQLKTTINVFWICSVMPSPFAHICLAGKWPPEGDLCFRLCQNTAREILPWTCLHRLCSAWNKRHRFIAVGRWCLGLTNHSGKRQDYSFFLGGRSQSLSANCMQSVMYWLIPYCAHGQCALLAQIICCMIDFCNLDEKFVSCVQELKQNQCFGYHFVEV